MIKHIQHPFDDLKKVDQLLGRGEPPCISVLVNLFTAGNLLKQNVLNIKRSIGRAVDSIKNLHIPEESKGQLISELESLAASHRNTGKAMAVGFFVSGLTSKVIDFPFSVIECSIVGKSFEVRDLLYFKQYLEPYYALSINRDSIHLFKGRGKELAELRAENLSLANEPEYEYAENPTIGHHGYSLKVFEKDKGNLSNVREETFVRSLTKHLADVINDPHAQLIVTGPSRLVNEVVLAYPYTDRLFRIDESFNGKNIHKFADVVWQKVAEARKDIIANELKNVGDLPLNRRAEGLRSVWEAAREGKGSLLLVERDFQRIAYRPLETDSIRLHPPKERYEVIADAVDDAIELVLNKHGRVIFTESGELGRYDGIVLTLRY